MKKVILVFMSIVTFMLSFYISASANEYEYIKGAKSGILIEQSSNRILFEKNIDEKLSPASMTKIMTLLLIFEEIDSNQLSKDTILQTSEYAASMGGSQVYLKVGEEITVDEAIKCVCIASANDCAVLLAEKIAGSEASFVSKMNLKAKELGCQSTNFSDCTGLTENNHYTTARDLALISRELLMKHSDVLSYTSIREDYIRKNTDSPFWLVNTNKMVGKIEGLNGLKTGYTSFSGYCITLSMTKNNMSLISVVFGYENANSRNTESIELLNYGFANYKIDLVIKKGTVLNISKHILYKNEVKLEVKEDIYYLCSRSENNDYKINYSYDLNQDNGNVYILLNDEVIVEKGINASDKPQKKNLFEIMCSFLKKCYLQNG